MSQNQKAVGNAQAIQAGGNVTLYNGMSPEQMSQIIVALTKEISALTNEARTTQERRFAELKDALLLEFSNPQTKAKTEALADPDFQYVVRDAHEAFARRGDEELKAELVNLIAERSVHASNTRVAQTINASIELAGKLSREEYSALVVIFTLQNVFIQNEIRQNIIPITDDILENFVNFLPKDGFSIQYLLSLGCMQANQFAALSFENVLTQKYLHTFGPGFMSEELENSCGNDDEFLKVLACTLASIDHLTDGSGQPDGCIRFNRGTESELRRDLKALEIGEPTQDRLVALLNSRMATEGEVVEIFRTKSRVFEKIAAFWSIPEVQQASPTLVGKALAHSALTSKGKFNAPLEIWLR